MKTINFLGYEVLSSSNLCINIDDKKNVINTINPHSYIVAKKDTVFQKALKDGDILLPDGVGIVWAIKMLSGKRIDRITGYDIHKYLLKKLNMSKGKVFYLGSSQSTLNKIEERINKDFPKIIVSTYSPPFKDEFTSQENNAMINAINSFKPDALFVGMTAPKQEKWVFKNKDEIDAKAIVSIGAVFDFYAGNCKRSPDWMIKLGLEWLYRSLGGWRLAKRNLMSNPVFLKDLLLEKLL